MVEVDLELLAGGYRHRPSSAAALERARRAAECAGLEKGSVALDIGGGRGAHARVFADMGAFAVVVDRSARMAEAAVAEKRVAAVRGDCGALPFAAGRFDLVYFHLALHYGDWRRNLAEAVRVGRGVVWIWTLGSDHHRASFLAEWFPAIVPIDEARFPEPADVADALADLGLDDVAAGKQIERVERTAGSWRAAVEAGFVSTLQMIPPGDRSAGLQRFDADHPDPSERVSYDLRFSWVRAGRL